MIGVINPTPNPNSNLTGEIRETTSALPASRSINPNPNPNFKGNPNSNHSNLRGEIRETMSALPASRSINSDRRCETD
jgi:hypothetical protein